MDLAYDDIGTGSPVVLLHAGMTDRRMWVHQVEPLAREHRVIVVDERGHGGSPWAPQRSPHQDLLALLDHLGIERAAVVGCSNGGRTALDTALAAPGRISALGLVAPGLSGFAMRLTWIKLWDDRVFSGLDAGRAAARKAGEPLTDDEVERVAVAQTRLLVAGPDRDESALTPEVWELALDMGRGVVRTPPMRDDTLDPPAVDRLGEISVPTLLITGDEDVPEILDMAEAIAHGVRDVRWLRLPDTGHAAPLERPDEVTAALLDFLGG